MASPKRSARGVLLVLAMFVLGAAMLAGLFLAPRPVPPPTTTQAVRP